MTQNNGEFVFKSEVAEIMRICANGDLYHRGELVTTNDEKIAMFHDFIKSAQERYLMEESIRHSLARIGESISDVCAELDDLKATLDRISKG